MKAVFSTALAVLLLAAAPLAAQVTSWQIDSAHSAAQFGVRHMMVSTVRGQFSAMSGTVRWDGKGFGDASVDITIDAASIDTRQPQRDAHLKSADFFDVAKYPTITFKSTKIEPAGPGKLTMSGTLTMHGVSKPVVFTIEGPTPVVKDMQGNLRVGATATTTINRKDFGLVYNALLEGGGVVIGEDVTITVDVEITNKTGK